MESKIWKKSLYMLSIRGPWSCQYTPFYMFSFLCKVLPKSSCTYRRAAFEQTSRQKYMQHSFKHRYNREEKTLLPGQYQFLNILMVVIFPISFKEHFNSGFSTELKSSSSPKQVRTYPYLEPHIQAD